PRSTARPGACLSHSSRKEGSGRPWCVVLGPKPIRPHGALRAPWGRLFLKRPQKTVDQPKKCLPAKSCLPAKKALDSQKNQAFASQGSFFASATLKSAIAYNLLIIFIYFFTLIFSPKKIP
ncbi:MAG: hypothetical protein LBF40_08695, partial [Deltaproteobacteria bacterium]|nr:hypothetical protein [Deltaproteobacteria bacterium]